MAKEKKSMAKQVMSLEEAKAYRASLYKEPKKVLSEKEKRMQFKLFWAKEKAKYRKHKSLEEVIWLHLKATSNDEPENFATGLNHFGLKKLK
jgi:hypothetical protein